MRRIFIIPCTDDRRCQLKILLNRLKEREPPHTEYYVVAQDLRDPFDRGMSLNVGFLLSKAHGLDMVVFHDVDTLPVEAFPKGYPTPLTGNEIIHLYGHEHSCGGIFVTTAKCYMRLGGYDSNPRWGGEDVAMQTRAHTFGVRLNKKQRVERFKGNYFIELDEKGNEIPNPLAHREWEKTIFGEGELRKLSQFNPDLTKPGSLYSRRQGVHVFSVEKIDSNVYLCRVRIEKIK
jgi:hypothetical protein